MYVQLRNYQVAQGILGLLLLAFLFTGWGVQSLIPLVSAAQALDYKLPPQQAVHEQENGQIWTLQATAYTHTGNPTFTGVYPHVGTIAVDPALIPLGSKMWVEGYGFGIAQDTGGAVKGEVIDLFMETKQECWQWGRRKVQVYILN